MSEVSTIPFHTFLWKVASRCNLDCTYCYVYHSPDARWREQPKFMSETVARQTARRMLEHLETHGKTDAAIVFHGGEPLLGGASHLAMLTRVIADELADSGIRLSVGMQSNLLLFNPEIGDLMRSRGMTIGVSIDGPPHINDRHRLDLAGRPSSARLEQKIALLCSEPYRELFSGVLCVLDPTTDPIEVTEYLLSLGPAGIDFLFPLDNHDRRPPGKSAERFEHTPYGDWLCHSFDCWSSRPHRTTIRIFDSMLRMICGGESQVESIGVGAVDLVVVETNGEIEAVDSLKSAFDGATRLGFNVFDHRFEEVAQHIGVRSRQLGVAGLCATCQGCPVVDICGGGYLPHRYSAARGFDNPSVYCRDLEKLIRHIHAATTRELSLVELQKVANS